MAGEAAALTQSFRLTQASVAAGADTERNVCICPWDGTVTAVQYVADTALTGANTDSRTMVLVNKGQTGSGTTVVATKAFTSGVNAAADTPTTITLSGTAANLVVAANDVLAWQSTHVGATGLADVGGMAQVTLSRTAGA